MVVSSLFIKHQVFRYNSPEVRAVLLEFGERLVNSTSQQFALQTQIRSILQGLHSNTCAIRGCEGDVELYRGQDLPSS